MENAKPGDSHDEFLDLNDFRGVGEDPVYHPPTLCDRPRDWPLDRWADAPDGLGYAEFSSHHWRGLRILKDPDTLSVYHDLLWELRPRAIIELGVYSGGSLVWFRDMTRLMNFDCRIVGIDRNLASCQIPSEEMIGIELREADCTVVENLMPLCDLEHPVLFIDDAHSNTFNVMRWAMDNLLQTGDYFVIEDMIPYWYRYSPQHLIAYLGAFNDVLAMDMRFANSCPQLQRGVFRRLAAGP